MSSTKVQKVRTQIKWRYDFTSPELIALGQKQTDLLRQKDKLDKELTSIKANYKSRVSAVDNEIGECMRLITDKFDMRDRHVLVYYHKPAQGQKEIYDAETGAFLGQQSMEYSELQDCLDFDGEPAATEPAPPPAEAQPAQPVAVEAPASNEGEKLKEPAGQLWPQPNENDEYSFADAAIAHLKVFDPGVELTISVLQLSADWWSWGMALSYVGGHKTVPITGDSLPTRLDAECAALNDLKDYCAKGLKVRGATKEAKQQLTTVMLWAENTLHDLLTAEQERQAAIARQVEQAENSDIHELTDPDVIDSDPDEELPL